MIFKKIHVHYTTQNTIFSWVMYNGIEKSCNFHLHPIYFLTACWPTKARRKNNFLSRGTGWCPVIMYSGQVWKWDVTENGRSEGKLWSLARSGRADGRLVEWNSRVSRYMCAIPSFSNHSNVCVLRRTCFWYLLFYKVYCHSIADHPYQIVQRYLRIPWRTVSTQSVQKLRGLVH